MMNKEHDPVPTGPVGSILRAHSKGVKNGWTCIARRGHRCGLGEKVGWLGSVREQWTLFMRDYRQELYLGNRLEDSVSQGLSAKAGLYLWGMEKKTAWSIADVWACSEASLAWKSSIRRQLLKVALCYFMSSICKCQRLCPGVRPRQ